jgi:hypothetical protein
MCVCGTYFNQNAWNPFYLFSKVGVLQMVIYFVNTDVSSNLRVASASVIVITLHLLMDGVYHNCTCWDCGFESCWEHVCLSLVSVVCCQVEVFVSG